MKKQLVFLIVGLVVYCGSLLAQTCPQVDPDGVDVPQEFGNIECAPFLFQLAQTSPAQTQVFSYGPTVGVTTYNETFAGYLNAAGYSTLAQRAYAIGYLDATPNVSISPHLIEIGINGSDAYFCDLGPISFTYQGGPWSEPASDSFNSGDIYEATPGSQYLKANLVNGSRAALIQIFPTPTPGTVTGAVVQNEPAPVSGTCGYNTSDQIWDQNHTGWFWSVDKCGNLFYYTPSALGTSAGHVGFSGNCGSQPCQSNVNFDFAGGQDESCDWSNFGAMYIDSDGYLWITENQTVQTFKSRYTTSEMAVGNLTCSNDAPFWQFVPNTSANGLGPLTNNDGFSCSNANYDPECDLSELTLELSVTRKPDSTYTVEGDPFDFVVSEKCCHELSINLNHPNGIVPSNYCGFIDWGDGSTTEFQDYSDVADGVKHCYVDGFAVDLNSGCAIDAYEINVGLYCCDDPDVDAISESLCVNCCPVECHAELAFWVDYVTTSSDSCLVELDYQQFLGENTISQSSPVFAASGANANMVDWISNSGASVAFMAPSQTFIEICGQFEASSTDGTSCDAQHCHTVYVHCGLNPEEQFCSEDLDGDGQVAVSDLLSLLSAFGATCQ